MQADARSARIDPSPKTRFLTAPSPLGSCTPFLQPFSGQNPTRSKKQLLINDEELNKLKVRRRSALMAQRSQPDFLARERTCHSIYPHHPYAKVSIPLEHLEKVEREDCVKMLYER